MWLPLTCPLLGTRPATQARALTESNQRSFGSLAGAQSTEPQGTKEIFNVDNYKNKFFNIARAKFCRPNKTRLRAKFRTTNFTFNLHDQS